MTKDYFPAVFSGWFSCADIYKLALYCGGLKNPSHERKTSPDKSQEPCAGKDKWSFGLAEV